MKNTQASNLIVIGVVFTLILLIIFYLMISENKKEKFGGWNWYGNPGVFVGSRNSLGFPQPWQASSPFDVDNKPKRGGW